MHNPFVYGRVVTGEEFIGRSALIKRIEGHIRSGQNVVIFGDRRVGKTSLVLEAIRLLDVSHLLIDFYEVRNQIELIIRCIRGIERLEKTSPFFSRWIKQGKRIRGRLKQEYDEPGMAPTVTMEGYFKQPVSSVTDLLDYIHAFQVEKPLVTFFDEFQGILGLDNHVDLLATMRSEIQMQGRIPYIFAGSIRRKMHEIFMDPKQPFYKSAVPIEIGPIDFDEMCPFVIHHFESGGRRVSSEHLRGLYNMLYGNTGDFQQLCSALWEVSKPGEVNLKERFRDALEVVWESELPVYAASRKALTHQQNRVLQTLALTNGKEPFGSIFRKVAGDISPGTVQKALAKLEDLDLVFQPHDSTDYRFYSPFFRLWLIGQATYPLNIPVD